MGPFGQKSMNRARLARVVWITSIVLVASWAPVHVLTGRGVFYPYWIAMSLDGLVSSTLGYLIVRHRPGNRVGWLFLGMGTTAAVALILGETAVSVAVSTLSGGLMIGSESLRLIGLFLLGFLALVYPTGHAPGRRWRWVGCVLGLAMIQLVVLTAIRPGPVLGSEWPEALILAIENPFDAAWLDGASRFVEALSVIGVVGFVGAVASVVARYRRARSVERQQLKIFVSAAVAGLVVLLGSTILLPTQMEGLLGEVLWDAFVLVPPAAATVAILRHGLFDIDRIISRTVVYAIVTAILGGVFALVALAPTAVAGAGGRAPDWIIAGGTLAVVALFRPVRRRVQDTLDRRFNRARYDAARTVEDFVLYLREEVDLTSLVTKLEALVATTMEPAQASVVLIDRPKPSTP